MIKYILIIAIVLHTQAAFLHQQTLFPSSHFAQQLDDMDNFHETSMDDDEGFSHELSFKGRSVQPARKETIVTLNKRVKVININAQIPCGWRKLTLFEGKQMKNSLKKLLNTWSIVAFDKGKMDGRGYGYKISDTYGPEVGERFIVKNA